MYLIVLRIHLVLARVLLAKALLSVSIEMFTKKSLTNYGVMLKCDTLYLKVKNNKKQPPIGDLLNLLH